jgi:hypothetical protein
VGLATSGFCLLNKDNTGCGKFKVTELVEVSMITLRCPWGSISCNFDCAFHAPYQEI